MNIKATRSPHRARLTRRYPTLNKYRFEVWKAKSFANDKNTITENVMDCTEKLDDAFAVRPYKWDNNAYYNYKPCFLKESPRKEALVRGQVGEIEAKVVARPPRWCVLAHHPQERTSHRRSCGLQNPRTGTGDLVKDASCDAFYYLVRKQTPSVSASTQTTRRTPDLFSRRENSVL